MDRLHWTYEYDGATRESLKVHQLWKDGEMVTYVNQYPAEPFGTEYAYIRGSFRPVIASGKNTIESIKKGLENWALGKGKVRVIED